jgi:hypothetical protein
LSRPAGIHPGERHVLSGAYRSRPIPFRSFHPSLKSFIRLLPDMREGRKKAVSQRISDV